MKIVHDPKHMTFTAVTDNGGEIGQIAYSPGENPGVILATHTHVNPDFQGQGVAQKLVDALAAHAEENGLSITPVCSYVVSSFRKHPEKYAKVASH